MIVLLEAIPQTDWTLVSALMVAVGALAGVVVVLWKAYNRARTQYEERLEQNASELVPQVLELGRQAKELHQGAKVLLEEAIKLRTLREQGGGPHARGAT